MPQLPENVSEDAAYAGNLNSNLLGKCIKGENIKKLIQGDNSWLKI